MLGNTVCGDSGGSSSSSFSVWSVITYTSGEKTLGGDQTMNDIFADEYSLDFQNSNPY